MLPYKPEEEASLGSQDVPQAVCSPAFSHSQGLTENTSLQNLVMEGGNSLWDQQHCIPSSTCLDLVRLADVRHVHEYPMTVLTGLST